MTENTPTYGNDLVHRLISLTEEGKLIWTPVFNTHPIESLGELKDLSAPVAYLVNDMRHGIGRVLLRSNEPENEIDEPTMYSQGERVSVSVGLLNALYAVVDEAMRHIQVNGMPNDKLDKDNIVSLVATAMSPIYQQVSELSEMVNELGFQSKAYITIMENLSEVVKNATAQPLATKEEKPDPDLALNPETAYLFLRRLVPGDDFDELFSAHYNAERIQKAIDEVHTYIKPKHNRTQ